MGIPTPEGEVVNNPGDAAFAGTRIGYPVVLKIQVQQGGRGKAGGVVFADDSRAAEQISTQLLLKKIRGERVADLLVEEKLDIAQEIYLGITFDQMKNMPVLLLSSAGGVDIESHAVKDSTTFCRLVLDPLRQPMLHSLTKRCLGIGLCGPALPKVADIARKLIAGYFRFDALTGEINPLVITTSGHVLAADAKFELDPSAVFRYKPGIPRFREEEDIAPLEREAAKKGLAYVQLEGGDVGIIAGGAGLSMATMDIVAAAGGRPANFLDLGGGASKEKTASALRMVLKTPKLKGVIMNLFGGINNCEVMADGIAQVMRTDLPRVPIVVKMRGYSQDEGWKILEGAGVSIVKHGTTESAVDLLMKTINGEDN